MEFSDETRQDIMDFQEGQQQLQLVMMQKQQIQLQLADIARAQEEATNSKASSFYRSVGSILVPKTKEELEADLKNEAESMKLRSDMLAKQEERLKSRLTALSEKLRKLESQFSGMGTGSGAGEGATLSRKAKGA